MKQFNKKGWVNRTWKNDSIRRAHVDVVDARETKGLWMMQFFAILNYVPTKFRKCYPSLTTVMRRKINQVNRN